MRDSQEILKSCDNTTKLYWIQHSNLNQIKFYESHFCYLWFYQLHNHKIEQVKQHFTFLVEVSDSFGEFDEIECDEFSFSQFYNIKVALKFQIPTAWGSKFTQKLENFDPSPEKPAQAYIIRKQHTQGTRRQFFRCRAFRCKFRDSNTLEFQLWCSHILKNPGPLRYQNHQVLSKLNFLTIMIN